MHSIHPAVETLPHPAATSASILFTEFSAGVQTYVRDMFTGAIGDHELPFRSREDADRIVVASLVARYGRRFTETDRQRALVYVAGQWAMVRLEAMAYHEAALLLDAQRMSNGQHITTLLDFVGDHWYARGRGVMAHAILRRRVGERFWTTFCSAEAWPMGANAHNVVRRELEVARAEAGRLAS